MFEIQISKEEYLHFMFAINIINRLEEYDIALVGGSNRDLLNRHIHNINKSVNDLDFSIFWKGGSGLTFSEFKTLSGKFKEMGDITVVDDGLKFLHIKVIGKNEYLGMELEFGTPRKEIYHDTTRKPDVNVGTVIDDINRRDFTINSIYTYIDGLSSTSGYCESDREYYVDLIPHPLFEDLQISFIDDLKNKILRTTSENPNDVFMEDPLRILRAIRFGNFFNKEI